MTLLLTPVALIISNISLQCVESHISTITLHKFYYKVFINIHHKSLHQENHITAEPLSQQITPQFRLNFITVLSGHGRTTSHPAHQDRLKNFISYWKTDKALLYYYYYYYKIGYKYNLLFSLPCLSWQLLLDLSFYGYLVHPTRNVTALCDPSSQVFRQVLMDWLSTACGILICSASLSISWEVSPSWIHHHPRLVGCILMVGSIRHVRRQPVQYLFRRKTSIFMELIRIIKGGREV